jgi:serine phosphatase RsbU (regulator of sigma subunit)
VTEPENPECLFFGDDALAALFAAASDADVSAMELARDITEAVDAFAHGHVQSDDITLLALRHLAY